MTRSSRLATAPACWLLVCTTLLASVANAGLTGDEQQLLGKLDPGRALASLKRLSQDVAQGASGLGAATIVSGSPEERVMAQELAGSMRKLGLEVRIEQYPVRAYRYGPITLTANGTKLAAIGLHAAGATWGRRDGVAFGRGNEQGGHRLRVPLVDAGDGYAADYAHSGDVRGKCVLVRRELRDWPPSQITEAAHHGALAIVFYGHPGAEQQPDALRQDSMWGHEQIPAAAVSLASAQALRKQLAAGPVEVTLDNEVELQDGVSRNVIGMIRGSEFPDEWVIVSAHFDRWFQGAADNTSGVAAVLEIARAVTQSGLKPRRSMLFMAVSSEEAGLEDPERDWLAGSYAFIGQHPDILRNAALIFNIDMLGWTSPKATLHSSPDMLSHARAVLADLGYASQLEVAVPTGSTTDAWNYGVVGGAATQYLERITPDYYPLYHTQMDAFRPELYANIGMDLRLLTLSLWRAASAARLPIELTAIADYVQAQLKLDAARVPELSFAQANAALAEFRAAAAAVEAWRDPAADEHANRILMATRHALAPWLYMSNGDYEQAVRTSEYANRIVAFDHALAALKAHDQTAAAAAFAELYEGRECQRLSPEVYALERGFWAGESGWASRFGQRAPPPPPAFELACAALGRTDSDPAAQLASVMLLRADAARAVEQAVALMSAKLRLATASLQEALRPVAAGAASP